MPDAPQDLRRAPPPVAAAPAPPHDIRRTARIVTAGCAAGLLLGSAPLLEWAERHELPPPVLDAIRAWDTANPLSGLHGAVRGTMEALQARRF